MTEQMMDLLEKQGIAFAAFKETVDNELKSKLGKDDPIVVDKLAKIEKSLDEAVEAKASLEAAIKAEAEEREELEARLNRLGQPGGEDVAAELKAANAMFAGHAASRNRGGFTPLDAEGLSAYKSAYGSYLRGGKDALSAEEVRAMSVGGDPQGGYLVAPDESGRIVKRVYETSPIRQIASVLTISTDKLEGIEDTDEAAAGWVGETASRPETDTPDLGKYGIEVFELYANPRVTQKLLDDASIDVAGWLNMKVADKMARVENAAFVGGSGALQPKGFASYTTAADDGSGVAWGSIGYVASGAAGAFASANPADKIHSLVGALKQYYLSNARFVTRRSVITEIRKFKDGAGQYLWQPGMQQGEPERLAGYEITRAEDVPALASNSLSLFFGDFREGYTIVDRLGIRVLVDPYTAKPYVQFYTTKRVGGGVTNFEAIKAMKFAAS